MKGKNLSQLEGSDMEQNRLLSGLLSYHQVLIDEQFINRVIRRIERLYTIRQLILAIASIVGSIIGTLGISVLWRQQWAEIVMNWQAFSSIFVTVLLISVMLFFTWIFNEEFDNP